MTVKLQIFINAFTRLHLVVILLFVGVSGGKMIDNRLLGHPVVTCGPDRIEIHASTESPFEGVVFVKNARGNNGCFRDYAQDRIEGDTNPGYSISIGNLSDCGLKMKRNSENKQLEILSVFVFSFHPTLVTMGDRAFAVHCIFRQTDISVATKFDFIAEISTNGIISGTAVIPLVVFKIVPGRIPDPKLNSAGTVRVGDPLMFIWYLPIASVRVIDCNAETMLGRRFQIVDNSCTLDRTTINDVTYADDQSKGYSDAMAFKFPDTDDLWFKCTVAVCLKSLQGENATNSENSCHASHVQTCARRRRRDIEFTHSKLTIGEDESSVEHRLYVLDAFGTIQQPFIYENTSPGKNRSITVHRSEKHLLFERNDKHWQLCMPRPIFALVSSLLLLLYIAAFVMTALASALYMRGRSNFDGSSGHFEQEHPTVDQMEECSHSLRKRMNNLY